MNDKYIIMDTGRCMFWKYNDYGYTTELKEARIFTLEEAIEKVNAPNVKDLMMIKLLQGGK